MAERPEVSARRIDGFGSLVGNGLPEPMGGCTVEAWVYPFHTDRAVRLYSSGELGGMATRLRPGRYESLPDSMGAIGSIAVPDDMVAVVFSRADCTGEARILERDEFDSSNEFAPGSLIVVDLRDPAQGLAVVFEEDDETGRQATAVPIPGSLELAEPVPGREVSVWLSPKRRVEQYDLAGSLCQEPYQADSDARSFGIDGSTAELRFGNARYDDDEPPWPTPNPWPVLLDEAHSHFGLRFQDDGHGGVWFPQGTAGTSAGVRLKARTWHHLAFTWRDGQPGLWYVDGKLVRSEDPAIFPVPGSDWTLVDDFRGLFARLRISGVVKSGDEIAARRFDGPNPSDEHFDFDDVSQADIIRFNRDLNGHPPAFVEIGYTFPMSPAGRAAAQRMQLRAKGEVSRDERRATERAASISAAADQHASRVTHEAHEQARRLMVVHALKRVAFVRSGEIVGLDSVSDSNGEPDPGWGAKRLAIGSTGSLFMLADRGDDGSSKVGLRTPLPELPADSFYDLVGELGSHAIALTMTSDTSGYWMTSDGAIRKIEVTQTTIDPVYEVTVEDLGGGVDIFDQSRSRPGVKSFIDPRQTSDWAFEAPQQRILKTRGSISISAASTPAFAADPEVAMPAVVREGSSDMAVAGDGSRLYWTSGWEIWSTTVGDASKPAAIVVSHADSPHPNALDIAEDGTLVWFDADVAMVRSMAPSGTDIVDLYPAPRPVPGALAVVPVGTTAGGSDTSYVFWVAARRDTVEVAVLDTPGRFVDFYADHTTPTGQHVATVGVAPFGEPAAVARDSADATDSDGNAAGSESAGRSDAAASTTPSTAPVEPLVFDASDGPVKFDPVRLDPRLGLTVAAELIWNPTDESVAMSVYELSSFGSEDRIACVIDEDGTPRLDLLWNGKILVPDTDPQSAVVLDPGVLHRVVWSLDGTGARVSLDGTIVSTTNHAWPGGAQVFDGHMACGTAASTTEPALAAFQMTRGGATDVHRPFCGVLHRLVAWNRGGSVGQTDPAAPNAEEKNATNPAWPTAPPPNDAWSRSLVTVESKFNYLHAGSLAPGEPPIVLGQIEIDRELVVETQLSEAHARVTAAHAKLAAAKAHAARLKADALANANAKRSQAQAKLDQAHADSKSSIARAKADAARKKASAKRKRANADAAAASNRLP